TETSPVKKDEVSKISKAKVVAKNGETENGKAPVEIEDDETDFDIGEDMTNGSPVLKEKIEKKLIKKPNMIKKVVKKTKFQSGDDSSAVKTLADDKESSEGTESKESAPKEEESKAEVPEKPSEPESLSKPAPKKSDETPEVLPESIEEKPVKVSAPKEEPKPEKNPESKPENIPEPKSEKIPEPKPEKIPEPKPEKIPEPKTMKLPEPKKELKPVKSSPVDPVFHQDNYPSNGGSNRCQLSFSVIIFTIFSILLNEIDN
ncbi:hypothetical protein SNEBB_005024, partial [Seison nebaliae]